MAICECIARLGIHELGMQLGGGQLLQVTTNTTLSRRKEKTSTSATHLHVQCVLLKNATYWKFSLENPCCHCIEICQLNALYFQYVVIQIEEKKSFFFFVVEESPITKPNEAQTTSQVELTTAPLLVRIPWASI